MTEFTGLTKNLISDKWRLMNWIVLVDLMFIVVIDILRLFNGGWDGVLIPKYIVAFFGGSAGIANFIGFILLSRNNERVLTSNNYRMIPVSDTKLYFSNLLTTFAAFIYLQILEGVVGVILYFISGNAGTFTDADFTGVASLVRGLVYVLIIISPILFWSAITAVHLIINWISGFLPFRRQKFVNFILELVVTILSLIIFNFTSGKVFKMFFENLQGTNISSQGQLVSAISIAIGVTIIWIVVISLINLYLLKRWTETVR